MKYSNVAIVVHLTAGALSTELNQSIIRKTEPFKHNETEQGDLQMQMQISRFISSVIRDGLPWKIIDRNIIICPSQMAYIEAIVND